SLLRLGKQRAILLLNGSRLSTNAFGKKVDRANEKRDDGKRKQGQLPVKPEHDSKCPQQGDARTNNVGEPFIVNCLNRLRIVGDAKTRISRATCVVKLERKPLQMRVKFGAQSQQRLQTDFHEHVFAGQDQETS